MFSSALEYGQVDVIKLLLDDDRLDLGWSKREYFHTASKEAPFPEIVAMMLEAKGENRIDNSVIDLDKLFLDINYEYLEGRDTSGTSSVLAEPYPPGVRKQKLYEVLVMLIDLKGDRRINVYSNDYELLKYSGSSTKLMHRVFSSGVDRIPPKEMFDKYYRGPLKWSALRWLANGRFMAIIRQRHAHVVHRDARMVAAQARIGRPMELRNRLYYGRYGKALERRDEHGHTPKEAATIRGNTDCVGVIEDIEKEIEQREIEKRKKSSSSSSSPF